MQVKLPYLTSPVQIRDFQEDNPNSLGFIPLEERSEIEKMRWFDQMTHNPPGVQVEMYPKALDKKS